MSIENIRELTAEIVAAYVTKNPVARTDIAEVVTSVAAALSSLGQPEKPALVPRVSIKKSVTPDYLISLEDGKQYKMLKRHLSNRGLTPDEYRKKWDLPDNYPMVAPNYSDARSAFAKKAGLGRQRPEATAENRRRASKSK